MIEREVYRQNKNEHRQKFKATLFSLHFATQDVRYHLRSWSYYGSLAMCTDMHDPHGYATVYLKPGIIKNADNHQRSAYKEWHEHNQPCLSNWYVNIPFIHNYQLARPRPVLRFANLHFSNAQATVTYNQAWILWRGRE